MCLSNGTALSFEYACLLSSMWCEQASSRLGDFKRSSKYLEQPIFNLYHSEHEMLRYLKRLENRDLSLAHSMIALVSIGSRS